MIGGIDIRIPSRAGDLSVEVAARAIRQAWPNATFEDGLTGDRYDHFWDIPFGETEELFVYRDPASAEIWDAEAATPDTSNRMVHIIADEGLITAVVDERTTEMEEIIAAIRSGLTDDLLDIPAMLMLEAA
jgi:hypothetical protein